MLNDGANTVSMYTVDSCSGTLTSTTPASVATGGNAFGSESMAVDPGGIFAYIANETGSVSIYALNSNSSLTSAGTAITTGSPYRWL